MPNRKMDRLSLETGLREGKIFKNGSKKTERNYIDFIVSGQSLGQLFGLPDFDLIGTFGWTDEQEVENKHINEFLGIEKPELKSGRISF